MPAARLRSFRDVRVASAITPTAAQTACDQLGRRRLRAASVSRLVGLQIFIWRAVRISSAIDLRKVMASTVWRLCFKAFLFPFGAPGEFPPCIRQRPFDMAGDWQRLPLLVLAPHWLRCIGRQSPAHPCERERAQRSLFADLCPDDD
jgi:hypothetical protein